MSIDDLWREARQDGAPTDAEYAADMQADHDYLHGKVCHCGQPKESSEGLCARCGQAEMVEAGRDYEEEERVERLLKHLPDGVYTASEMKEYLT